MTAGQNDYRFLDHSLARLTSSELRATARSLVELQRPWGEIPWFIGGHTDPWNHVEAAMALSTIGFREQAEAGYQWMADSQYDDGSWSQYYAYDGSVEEDRRDTNVISYVAVGVWHHTLIYQDRDFANRHFDMVDRALGFVTAHQGTDGAIPWALTPEGVPEKDVLLTGSSSVYLSFRAGTLLAERLGIERPQWTRTTDMLENLLRNPRGRFTPKHEWAMDWYYPVMVGAVGGQQGRDRLAERWDTFVTPGWGCRCVSRNAWFTAAETSEAAMAHLAVKEWEKAELLLASTRRCRDSDGSYFTGITQPERVYFPDMERSSYSAAAVILANDALYGDGPGHEVFDPTV